MKKTHREDFRVEVYPRSPGDFGFAFMSGREKTEAEWEEDCREIARDIERHVDGLPTRGTKTSIVWDTVNLCSFCGSQWTEDDDQYNGGCCSKDQELQDAREAAQP